MSRALNFVTQPSVGVAAADLQRLSSLSTSLRDVYKQQYWAALGLPFWGVRRTLGQHAREQTDLISRIACRARGPGAPSPASAARALLLELEHSCDDGGERSRTLVGLTEAQRYVAAQAEALESHLADAGDEEGRRVAWDVAALNYRQAAALAVQLSLHTTPASAVAAGSEVQQVLHAVLVHVLRILVRADAEPRGTTLPVAMLAIAADLSAALPPLAHLLPPPPLREEPRNARASSCAAVPPDRAPLVLGPAADRSLLDSLDQLVERAAALAWDLSWLSPLVDGLRRASDHLWDALTADATRPSLEPAFSTASAVAEPCRCAGAASNPVCELG